MEIPKNFKPNFYPTPMRLQQKTGQVGYRVSPNEIIFVSGTDTTYTFFSRKSYRFKLKEKEVKQLGFLETGRYNFCLCKLDVKKNNLFRIIYML